jgi:hypothetical protein
MVSVEQMGLKQASLKEVKNLVEAYLKEQFEKGKQVYPSDAADALGLDYTVVREVFCELENEGKIQESR